jgi:hypothetical protein
VDYPIALGSMAASFDAALTTETDTASMAYVYFSANHTLAEVGAWFSVSYVTASRALKAIECKM